MASPLNIADLKLRLARKTIPLRDRLKLFQELRNLGADVAELLPLALQRCTEGALPLPVPTLIEFYQITRDRTVLDHLVRHSDHLKCGPREQCTLLEFGLSEVEAPLCDSLWENWHNTGEYPRGHVAKTLGSFGSQRSRELLEVIEFKLAGQTAEKQARVRQMTNEEADQGNVVVAGMEAQADVQFLEIVRVAVREIQRRLATSAAEAGFSSAEIGGASDTVSAAAAELYELTSESEKILIKFLLTRLKSTGSDWWVQRIREPIRKKCAERQEEEKNKHSKEAYLDLTDIKQVLRDNRGVFEQSLRSAGFTGSKDKALEWMDRLNRLRRMSAHPAKQEVEGFRLSPEDLRFLEEINQKLRKLPLQ